MSTLKTQYETFIKNHPDLNLTFEDWEIKYLTPKLGKLIPITESNDEDENKDKQTPELDPEKNSQEGPKS